MHAMSAHNHVLDPCLHICQLVRHLGSYAARVCCTWSACTAASPWPPRQSRPASAGPCCRAGAPAASALQPCRPQRYAAWPWHCAGSVPTPLALRSVPGKVVVWDQQQRQQQRSKGKLVSIMPHCMPTGAWPRHAGQQRSRPCCDPATRVSPGPSSQAAACSTQHQLACIHKNSHMHCNCKQQYAQQHDHSTLHDRQVH